MQPRGFLKHRDSWRVSPAVLQNLPEQCGRFANGRVVGGQIVFAHVEALSSQLFGFIEFRLRVAKAGESNQCVGIFRAVGSKQRLALLKRDIQELVGLFELAQILVDGSERLINFRLRPRIAGQRVRLLYSTINQGNHA